MIDPRKQLVHAYEQYQQRQFAAAEQTCIAALAAAGPDADLLHLLALTQKQLGRSNEAEQSFRRSISLQPARPEFHANYANLLHAQGRALEARREYEESLRRNPSFAAARLGLARSLNDLGEAALAEVECRSLLAAGARDAQVLSTLAAALRKQQRLADAEQMYREALTLNPAYAVGHHNLGALLCQTDRAEEALEALDRAQRLGVNSRELHLNRGHALLKCYQLAAAEQAYSLAVQLQPRDLDAQLSLARLRFMLGDRDFARDLLSAASAAPADIALQIATADVLRRAGVLDAAELILRRTLAAGAVAPELDSALARVLFDQGDPTRALQHAEAAVRARPGQPALVEQLVITQLALGRAAEARALISEQRSRHPLDQRWLAYEATAACALGDPLQRALYDYQRFVRCYDLTDIDGFSSIAELNQSLQLALRGRHRFATHPLDQSLRHGTQTARSLLTESDPAIRAALSAFARCLEDYVRAIGSDVDHPLTARNTGAARIDKCWSVQLQRDGFHVNHVHPEGWISSAYYVFVPAEVDDTTAQSGWINFGAPPFEVPGCAAAHVVQPRAGRLVLFPSYMWHGTTPIRGLEPRLTMAFDAVPV